MAARRKTQEVPKTRRRPATTSEGRENQLVSQAMDLAEEQMQRGTASSQVITHFLKLGTAREELERDRLRADVELARAKIDAIASQQRIEELYGDAIKAMRNYAGEPAAEDSDEPD